MTKLQNRIVTFLQLLNIYSKKTNGCGDFMFHQMIQLENVEKIGKKIVFNLQLNSNYTSTILQKEKY